MSDEWLLELLREFSPKIVPLDVHDGGYEEATTRWGINHVWEAVPVEIRSQVERSLSETVQHELAFYRERDS